MALIIAHPPSESSRTNTLSGTGIDFPVDNLDTNLTTSNGYYAMPRPEYLIRWSFNCRSKHMAGIG